MRFRRDSSVAKTASFAVIHLAIAVSLGWLFTGGLVLGGLLALVEPTVNTVVAHHLEQLMRRLPVDPARRRFAQSALLTVSHFVVAIGVGWMLSSSFWVATAYAVVEPLANGIAHFFFDRWWERRREAGAAPQAA